MSDSSQSLTPFEDDPILGAFVAYYPANRLRLLMVAGGVMAMIWFVVTVSLWNVPDDTAIILTILLITLPMLIIGWWALHLWNREITLYEHGFSYRRGGQVAYIHYLHVVAIRQSGTVIVYLGGLIRRNTFRLMLTTDVDEQILVDATYARSAALMRQLEAAITQIHLSSAHAILAEGAHVDFSGGLSVSGAGIHDQGGMLEWGDVQHMAFKGDILEIIPHDSGKIWQIPLSNLVNVSLLLILLREHVPSSTGGQAS